MATKHVIVQNDDFKMFTNSLNKINEDVKKSDGKVFATQYEPVIIGNKIYYTALVFIR